MIATTLPRPALQAPTSEGAHRLAWWLAPIGEAGFERLAAHAGVSLALINRLLSGEVEPSGAVAIAIARETEGDVLPMDWERETSRGWLDRPHQRDTALQQGAAR